MEVSVVNAKGTSHLLRVQCWSRGAGFPPLTLEEKQSPRDRQEDSTWIGLPTQRPLPSSSEVRMEKNWQDSSHYWPVPTDKEEKGATSSYAYSFNVIENLEYVGCGASMVYMRYYLLKIMMHVCYHDLHPTHKETEAPKEWKSYGNCTGTKVELQIPVSLTPGYMFFTKVIVFLLHFHNEISLEEENEHYAHVAPNTVTASPWCIFFHSSLLPADVVLYIQFCNLTFSTLCFSLLLHGFYSHHFNDVHNIPLLGRC